MTTVTSSSDNVEQNLNCYEKNLGNRKLKVGKSIANKKTEIIDAIPKELLDRIKESSKKRCISVIEPIAPNKKSRTTSTTEAITTVDAQKPLSTVFVSNAVFLDHDYCGSNVKIDMGKKFEIEDAGQLNNTTTDKELIIVKDSSGQEATTQMKVNFYPEYLLFLHCTNDK